MTKGKEDSFLDKRKKQRRSDDRCPGCVIDKVEIMEVEMAKMSKGINRLIGAHGVVLLVFSAAILFMFKFSINASDANERIEVKFDKVAIKQAATTATQKHILATQGRLLTVNSGMARYVEQMAKDNSEQTSQDKAQTKLLQDLLKKQSE